MRQYKLTNNVQKESYAPPLATTALVPVMHAAAMLRRPYTPTPRYIVRQPYMNMPVLRPAPDAAVQMRLNAKGEFLYFRPPVRFAVKDPNAEDISAKGIEQPHQTYQKQADLLEGEEILLATKQPARPPGF